MPLPLSPTRSNVRRIWSDTVKQSSCGRCGATIYIALHTRTGNWQKFSRRPTAADAIAVNRELETGREEWLLDFSRFDHYQACRPPARRVRRRR